MKVSEKSLWALLLSSVTVSQGQISLNDQNIHSAILLWFSDEQSARDTYGDINDWDTSQVTDFSQLFASKSTFDDDISNWDTSSVTTMAYMFNGAKEFNQPIGQWNVSQVTNFNFFLGGASTFNQDLRLWQPEKATTMSFMFMGASSFNGDIGAWGVSSVEYFNGMFFGATAFDRYVGTWDVSTAISFASMFYGAASFNKDISLWNTDNIVNMDLMFMRATSFNQPLSDWDVSNVKTMKNTFSTASAFNQDLSDWDVTSVTDMSGIFDDAKSFAQTICWDLGSVVNMKDAFCGSQGSFDTTCIRGLINDSSRSSCPETVSPTITSVPTTPVIPSVLPSISPIVSPTPSPTVAPSQAPDEPKACAVDENGSYGMSNGESNLVEYNYEMQTSKSITGSQATYIMDLLEPEVTNLVIQGLFTDCTAQAKRRLSSFLGLTTAPKDQILNHVGCIEGTESDTESCYVVKGEFTLYSLFGEDVNTALTTANQIIKFTMDNGEFDFQTNDGIDVRTTYREASSIPTARGVDVNSSNDDDDDDNDLNWVWAVVGVTGGLFLMYGGIRILKRRADGIRIETEESVFTEVAKPSTQSYRASKQYDDDNGAFPHVRTKETDIEEAEIFLDEPFNEGKDDDSSSDSDSSGSSGSSSSSSILSSDDDDDSDAEADDNAFDPSRSAEFATKFRSKLSERAFIDETNKNDNCVQPQLQSPIVPTRGGEQIRNTSLGDQQVESRGSTSNNSIVSSRIGNFEAQIAASGKKSVKSSSRTSATTGTSSKIGDFEAQIAAAGNHHQDVVEPSGSGDSNFKTQIAEAAAKSHSSTAFEV